MLANPAAGNSRQLAGIQNVARGGGIHCTVADVVDLCGDDIIPFRPATERGTEGQRSLDDTPNTGESNDKSPLANKPAETPLSCVRNHSISPVGASKRLFGKDPKKRPRAPRDRRDDNDDDDDDEDDSDDESTSRKSKRPKKDFVKRTRLAQSSSRPSQEARNETSPVSPPALDETQFIDLTERVFRPQPHNPSKLSASASFTSLSSTSSTSSSSSSSSSSASAFSVAAVAAAPSSSSSSSSSSWSSRITSSSSSSSSSLSSSSCSSFSPLPSASSNGTFKVPASSSNTKTKTKNNENMHTSLNEIHEVTIIEEIKGDSETDEVTIVELDTDSPDAVVHSTKTRTMAQEPRQEPDEVESWILHDPNSFEVMVFLFSLALVHDNELSECELPIDIICEGDATKLEVNTVSLILSFGKLPHVTALRALILEDESKRYPTCTSDSNPVARKQSKAAKRALKAHLDQIDKRFYRIFQYLASDEVVKLRTKRDVLENLPRMQLWINDPRPSSRKSAAFESRRHIFGSFFAFHGSPLANFYSILQGGLRNLSGTKHQAHGAARGSGVYTSTETSQSFGFSKRTWKTNLLARRSQENFADCHRCWPWIACGLHSTSTRIMALVEIVSDSSAFTKSSCSRTVVVQDDAVIRLRCLMVGVSDHENKEVKECLPSELERLQTRVPFERLFDSGSRRQYQFYRLQNRGTRDIIRPCLPLDMPTYKVLRDVLKSPKRYEVVNVATSTFGLELSVKDMLDRVAPTSMVILGQYLCCSCLGKDAGVDICSHLAHVMIHVLKLIPSMDWSTGQTDHLEIIWQKELNRTQYLHLTRAVRSHLRDPQNPGSALRLPPFDKKCSSSNERPINTQRRKKGGHAVYRYFAELAGDTDVEPAQKQDHRRDGTGRLEDTDLYRSIWAPREPRPAKPTPYCRHYT